MTDVTPEAPDRAIRERHVPYWAAKMTRTTPGASDPAMRGDDVRQWCRKCESAWPCDARVLLDRLDKGLDAAWAEAEAAFPGAVLIVAKYPDRRPEILYEADAFTRDDGVVASAEAPATAVRALIAKAQATP